MVTYLSFSVLVEDVLEEELFEIFLQTDYTLSIEEVAKDFAQKLLKRLFS